MPKNKFLSFEKCLKMMESRDPQKSEDGFHCLLPKAHEYTQQLIDEYQCVNEISPISGSWNL